MGVVRRSGVGKARDRASVRIVRGGLEQAVGEITDLLDGTLFSTASSIRALNRPDHYPPVEGLQVDHSGRIWVRIPSPPGRAIEHEVFDTAGVHVANVRFPSDRGLALELMQFGRGRVLVPAISELDAPPRT
jgi:hypothetical protein